MQSFIIPNWSRKPRNDSLSSFYLKEAEESSGSSSLLYDSGVAQDQDSQDPDSRSSSPEMIPPGWLKTSGVAKVFFFIPYMAFLIQHVSWFLLGSLSITILRNFSCDKFYRKVFDGLKVKMQPHRRTKTLATRVRGVRALSLFQGAMRGWGRRQRCGSIFLCPIELHASLFACLLLTVFLEVWFFRYGVSTTSWWERERWRDACPLGPCHLYQGWSSNHLILVAKEVETQILT